MKITVSTQVLMDALRKVLNVVSSRSTIPVLSNVLLSAKGNQLSLATTDLEVSITTTVEATVEREGDITLPAKKFGQIVGTLRDGEVTLDRDDFLVTKVSCGNATFKISGLSAAEFPKEPDFMEDRSIAFPALDFGKILKKIAYAVSTDQTRYVLNGILLSVREGNFTAVATDGRRLALVEKILDDPETVSDGDVILPVKVVNELQKVMDANGDVEIKFSEARASFTMGSTIITSKLVEGTYPNYRQVIPAAFKNSVMIPRAPFSEVLNRVSVVVSDSSASVKFKLEGNGLNLSASSAEYGEATESLEIAYDGESLAIAFNPEYVKEPLRNLDCDELTLRFNDEFKPIVLLGDEGFLYVIMPMRN